MEDVTSSLDPDKRLGKSTATATETVKAFCVQFSKSKLGMHEAIRAHFTPTTVWENVGLAVTTGIDEALGVLAQFNQAMGIDAIDIEILAIAADGDRVLTERIDHLLRADGSEVWDPRVMGIFEIEDGRIRAWRDYFDSAKAQSLANPG
jgi:limonene-1,2-epoxide hydrolase